MQVSLQNLRLTQHTKSADGDDGDDDGDDDDDDVCSTSIDPIICSRIQICPAMGSVSMRMPLSRSPPVHRFQVVSLLKGGLATGAQQIKPLLTKNFCRISSLSQ